MRRIILLNAKGGCGKTTIATNLASYYASQGRSTTLIDYDPQGSSMKWLSNRSWERAHIHGIAAFQKPRGAMTRAFQMSVPPGTERVVMDAPAGVAGAQLLELVRSVDTIIIPVLPSPIDIHAASRFIQELLLVGKVRSLNIRLGVVANRVKPNTLVFHALQRFLKTLHFPFITQLRDSQSYMRAAENGVGIGEIDEARAKRDCEQWRPLVRWLEDSADTGARPNAASGGSY